MTKELDVRPGQQRVSSTRPDADRHGRATPSSQEHNRRRRVCPPQGLTALAMSGNTSDALDMLRMSFRAARTECRRLCNHRRQLSSCFSLPFSARECGMRWRKGGREISSGMCSLISRTRRLVFGLQATGGGDARVEMHLSHASHSLRAPRGVPVLACLLALPLLQRSGRVPVRCCNEASERSLFAGGR